MKTMPTTLLITHRVLLMVALAVWFGGFTFYTSVVVPIGTDVLGSSRTQGFVTQQVTHVLNIIGGFALAIGLIDLFVERARRSVRVTTFLSVILLLLIVLWIALLFVHPMLDLMLEPEHEYVADEARFYQLHRVYLWVSTFQWLFCWVWLVLIIRGWSIGPAFEVNRPDALHSRRASQ